MDCRLQTAQSVARGLKATGRLELADEEGREFGLGHSLIPVDDGSEEYGFIETEKGNHNAVLDKNALPGNTASTGAGPNS